MLKLPVKYSKKWGFVLVALFFLTFIACIAFTLILGSKISANNVVGLVLFSTIVSALISLGGFLGARLYFITASIFDVLGIVYMLFVSINKTAEDWSDLVGMVSYIFIVAMGLILGFVIQLLSFLISKRKR